MLVAEYGQSLFQVFHVALISCRIRNIADIIRSTISAKLKLFYRVMVGGEDIYYLLMGPLTW
jgi:hypothetical protein